VCKGVEEEILPEGLFLDSNTTRSCSYTWRSLMYGKELLLQGIVWRVGEGDNVRITEDRWVPQPTTTTTKSFIPK
jgi:hypothetical protein